MTTPPPPPVTAQPTPFDERRTKSIRTVRNAGDLVMFIGWLVLLVGIAVGVIVALQTEDRGLSDDGRPYFVEGVAIGVGSVLVGAMFALVGYWATAWANVNE